MRRIFPFVLATGLLFPAGASFGVDGVLEINEACAVKTGCFTGDGAGFPVTISQSGSYRLTGNLTVADENTTAIDIDADDVSLDMGGFTIAGPVTCTGDPVTGCSATGSGNGVGAISTVNVSVTNGTIRGMGNDGLNLFKAAHVARVVITENGGDGIFCRNACTVTDSKILRNGGVGIFQGVVVSTPEITPGSAFSDNVVGGNLAMGIRFNDFVSRVWGNTIVRNGDVGIGFFGSGGYGSNVLGENNGGNANPQVSGTGIEIAPNVCGGDLVCP